MNKNSGFTLVEMLVSMVLLSMVLLIATNAYSQFSQRWNGRLGHFNQSFMQAKNLVLVQESLNSIIAYAVTDDFQQAKFYFEGNRNGFVAVTLRSVFTPEVAAVVRFQATQNEDFTYTLSYQESAMDEQLLINATQSLVFENTVILFDNLVDINFQYYGFPSTADANFILDNTFSQPEPKTWFNEYNSLEKNLQPEQIQINFITQTGEFTLQTKLNNSVPGLLTNYASQE